MGEGATELEYRRGAGHRQIYFDTYLLFEV
jgi:hypothetical protein